MADPDEELFTTLHRLVQPYRNQLMARSEKLTNQITQLAKKRDEAYEDAATSNAALSAAIPETSGDERGLVPTVELLTRRNAEIARDVAFYANEVAAIQLHLKYTKATAERDELNVRIWHIDHLVEDSDPARSPGNDDWLAVRTLEAHQSALEVASAETTLQLTRRMLDHAKRAQRAIHATLRKEQIAKQADNR